MIPSFCNQSILRKRPGRKESRGSVILDWNNTTDVTITPVSVQPVGGAIDVDGRVLGVTDTYNVYMNLDGDVIAGDRVVYEGRTYDVNQEPSVWQSPTGRVSSKQFSMTLHKG